MKYAFTTLAVGESFFNNSLKEFKAATTRLDGDFFITTDMDSEDSKVKVNKIPTNKFFEKDYNSSTFYYNLKCLSLKPLITSDYDIIVYIDADWAIKDNLTNEVMSNLLSYMDANKLDFLFERPGKVKGHKEDKEKGLCYSKLQAYNVFDHNLWDEAHIVNEQFLVFRNNWKFRYFVQRWEQFLWYSIHNNIWNFAEGFEIGVSSYEAKMNYDFNSLRHVLPNCFEFKDKNGKNYIRF